MEHVANKLRVGLFGYLEQSSNPTTIDVEKAGYMPHVRLLYGGDVQKALADYRQRMEAKSRIMAMQMCD